MSGWGVRGAGRLGRSAGRRGGRSGRRAGSGDGSARAGARRVNYLPRVPHAPPVPTPGPDADDAAEADEAGTAADADRRILDTSAILSGKPLAGRFVVPPAVEDEVQPGGRTGRTMDYLRSAGLEVRAPGEEAVAKAREAAGGTGDLDEMSAADLEVVALAVESGLEVVTDDYRVQNVLRALDLAFRPLAQRGIRSQWTWTYLCAACGRTWEHAWEACPVCGGDVEAKRKR